LVLTVAAIVLYVIFQEPIQNLKMAHSKFSDDFWAFLQEFASQDNPEEKSTKKLSNAKNSSVYLKKYEQLGGKDIFEAMMDEFYDTLKYGTP
jgi:hypothetical protein